MEKAGFVIVCYHSDNGGEFDNIKLIMWSGGRSIIWEFTAAYAHSQNAKAERISRTCLARTRAVIFETNLPRHLWNEVLKTIVNLKNVSPQRGKEKVPGNYLAAESQILVTCEQSVAKDGLTFLKKRDPRLESRKSTLELSHAAFLVT